MVSNTKLFPEQKQWIDEWFENNPAARYFNNGEITVIVKPDFKGSRMFQVSISTCSPNENKFRPSVGKYYAITYMENGQYTMMNYDTMEAFLDNTMCLNANGAFEKLLALRIN